MEPELGKCGREGQREKNHITEASQARVRDLVFILSVGTLKQGISMI